jgi:hypothetical protein
MFDRILYWNDVIFVWEKVIMVLYILVRWTVVFVQYDPHRIIQTEITTWHNPVYAMVKYLIIHFYSPNSN